MLTWNVAMSWSNLPWWPVTRTVQVPAIGAVVLLLAIGALMRRKAAGAS